MLTAGVSRCTCSLLLPYVCSRSTLLLTPLLSPAMLSHPAWASWCKLAELFTLCMKHTLKVSDVTLIDDLQLEYCKLFDHVPEYVGLKRPKHHFLAHLAPDIWRFGPLRGFWTMGFEGNNKTIKAGAERSNWKDESRTVMQYWSMRSGHEMMRSVVQHV